jgi:prepilin signal peptidase PulO-like enzyme (type II secretory pathway)
MGTVFGLVSYGFLRNIEIFSLYGLPLLLVFAFVTGVYVISDLIYTEIPDEIIIPGFYISFLVLVGGFFAWDLRIWLFDIPTYTEDYRGFFIDHMQWAWILYTFIFLQILIPGWAYLLKQKKYRDLIELMISYFTFPVLMVGLLWKRDVETWDDEALPTWVWGGDLRVALFIGITLGLLHGVAAFFIAYIIGSFVGIFFLIGKKGKKEIPLGPFLALGWCLSLIFYPEILAILG